MLGVPCLTLRDNTERPITVTEGTNQLVGRDPDAHRRRRALEALDGGVQPRRPALWDGHAGDRIADVIVDGGRERVVVDRRRATVERRLRVLIVAPTCDGDDVGEAWVAHQWVRRLADRHDVTLLTYSQARATSGERATPPSG